MRVATTRSILAAAMLCLAAAACSDDSNDGPLSPDPIEPEESAEPLRVSDLDITVMTRNMYVGADVDAVITALATPDPADDQAALVAAIGTLQETDFAARAAAMAREIERARPHVVGLQEVSKVDITLPPLGVDLHLDFLPTLLAELAARGLHYEVAVRVRNIEAAPFPGVSLLDEDAILVDRKRVRMQETAAHSFTANIGQVAPGVLLARGWVSAKIAIGNRAYTVASTHLESGDAAGTGSAPRGAGVGARAGTRRPRADRAHGRPERRAGLAHVPGAGGCGAHGCVGTAAWDRRQGFTCCHAADLSNAAQQFTKRIDYVFVRDGRERGTVTGVSPEDR